MTNEEDNSLDTCVMCGAVIPEGAWICPCCKGRIERGEMPGREN